MLNANIFPGSIVHFIPILSGETEWNVSYEADGKITSTHALHSGYSDGNFCKIKAKKEALCYASWENLVYSPYGLLVCYNDGGRAEEHGWCDSEGIFSKNNIPTKKRILQLIDEVLEKSPELAEKGFTICLAAKINCWESTWHKMNGFDDEPTDADFDLNLIVFEPQK